MKKGFLQLPGSIRCEVPCPVCLGQGMASEWENLIYFSASQALLQLLLVCICRRWSPLGSGGVGIAGTLLGWGVAGGLRGGRSLAEPARGCPPAAASRSVCCPAALPSGATLGRAAKRDLGCGWKTPRSAAAVFKGIFVFPSCLPWPLRRSSLCPWEDRAGLGWFGRGMS